MEIDEVSGWLAVVSDNVAHQDVEDVVVDRDGFAKTRHGKRMKHERKIRKTIPINGQHFLARDVCRVWTRAKQAP